MAVLEYIHHQPMKFEPSSEDVKFGFIPDTRFKTVERFPQIFFSNGEPWKEANQYAFNRFYDSNKDLKTVTRELGHLSKYADWLEQNNLHWLHFPMKKRGRCLYRFRGYLIECRENTLLAPSTVTQIMSLVVKFYRWAHSMGFTDSTNSLWQEQTKSVNFFDKVGFSRTMSIATTDLAIPNRRRGSVSLEDGLIPLTQEQVATLVKHLKQHSNYELYLMHKIALLTGSRYETVTTLTIDALKNSYIDPSSKSQMRVRVGPGTQVKTKFDVSGEILFPKYLVEELIHYYESIQAVIRRANASPDNFKLIFLTIRGNPYTRESFSTLMKRLRDELFGEGYSEFKKFKFHQLRVTFGTMLMKSALDSKAVSTSSAIEYVQYAMLHKDPRTTWKYVQFIEKEPIQEEFHKLLWELFTNEKDNSDDLIDELTGFYDE